jgi:hypothetical protein
MGQLVQEPHPADVLGEALLATTAKLGLTQESLATIVGRTRTRLKSIPPNSKSGEAAMGVIRVYRSLYALVNGDTEEMRAWMSSPNKGTGGIPAVQIETLEGLFKVVRYLDAIRGKV